MLSAICQAGGMRMLILMNMRIGAKNGIIEQTVANVPSGFCMTAIGMMIVNARHMTMGVWSCCAS